MGKWGGWVLFFRFGVSRVFLRGEGGFMFSLFQIGDGCLHCLYFFLEFSV